MPGLTRDRPRSGWIPVKPVCEVDGGAAGVTAFIAWRCRLATLLAASLVVFLVLQVLPGDPATLMLGHLRAPRHAGGAAPPDGPRSARPGPLRRAGSAAWSRGDFGTSYTYSVPVAELIRERVMVSLPLAVMAIVSVHRRSPSRSASPPPRGAARAPTPALMGVAQIGVALPNFWLGLLLILLFAMTLPWFPASGFPGWDAGAWPAMHALLLPALALALPQAAILARVTRAAVLETLGPGLRAHRAAQRA